MIQRIQSVYLVLAALLFVAFCLVHSPWSAGARATSVFSIVLIGVGALLALGSLVAVFLYAVRERQLLAIQALLFGTLFLLGMWIGRANYYGRLADLLAPAAHYDLYLELGLIAFGGLGLVLAAGGVRRDIALVRSMDRLR